MKDLYDPVPVGPVPEADEKLFEENFGTEEDASPGACFAFAHDAAAEEPDVPEYDYDGEDTDIEDEDDAEEIRIEKEEAAAARRGFPPRMFASASAPAEFPGYDELAKRYAETHDEKYYAWILHYHEKRMTERCLLAMRQNRLSDGLEDLKNAYAAGLYDALNIYDPNAGVPFMAFKKWHVKNSLNEVLYVLVPGFSLPSVYEYRHMKTVMAVWRGDQAQDGASVAGYETAMERAAGEIDLTVRTAKDIFSGAVRNSEFTSLYRTETDEDGEETEEEQHGQPLFSSQIIPSPEQHFFMEQRGNAVFGAYESLSDRAKWILAEYLGFCSGCYGVQIKKKDKDGNPVVTERKPLPLTEIAAMLLLRDADTVQKEVSSVVEAMREYLHQTDWFADTDFEKTGAIENERYERRRQQAEERKRQEAEQKQPKKKQRKKKLPPTV